MWANEYPRMRALLAIVAGATLATIWPASGWPQPGKASSRTVTIEVPRHGARTRERTARVKGRAPVVPRGGEVAVTVSVNGRPLEVEPHDGRYRASVVLGVGVNRIVAKAEVYGPGDEDLDPVTTVAK